MFYSPLRYPGGKGKLAPFMKSIIEITGHVGGTYIEPFAGGAGIALDLLENDREVRDISMYINPLYYTDTEYYNEDSFSGVPSLIIHLAKNEIYARHGYIFKDENLKNYFMGQLWYIPSVKAEEFDDSVFSDIEKRNLELLNRLDTYKK